MTHVGGFDGVGKCQRDTTKIVVVQRVFSIAV
jgi:hypothetical protein